MEELRLVKIHKLHGRLELLSGMRIGASEGEIRIGGVDNQVIRHPHTNDPYIPGSSLKGKVRSLLEWLSGAVQDGPISFEVYKRVRDRHPLVKPILQLFGIGGGDNPTEAEARELGPTRLAFWDAPLNREWRSGIINENNLLVEVKTENQIDRIKGVAQHPRQTERVPSGAEFDFTVSMKVLNIDGEGAQLRSVLYRGLRLLELDSLGGSGSRGYGKVKFHKLKLDDHDAQAEFAGLDPFQS
jgi:CRISPR-associated protein Csm3